MKQIFMLAAGAAFALSSCVAPKPLPEGTQKVEATYFGYYKKSGIYVLKYYTRLYDTIRVYQNIKPHFHMRDQVYLEWNCMDSLSDVKILKNR